MTHDENIDVTHQSDNEIQEDSSLPEESSGPPRLHG